MFEQVCDLLQESIRSNCMSCCHTSNGTEGKIRKCGKCGLYDTRQNTSTCELSQKPVVKRPKDRPKGTGHVKICLTSDDDGNELLTEDDVV